MRRGWKLDDGVWRYERTPQHQTHIANIDPQQGEAWICSTDRAGQFIVHLERLTTEPLEVEMVKLEADIPRGDIW